jgi:hypothetical protein
MFIYLNSIIYTIVFIINSMIRPGLFAPLAHQNYRIAVTSSDATFLLSRVTR